MTSPSTLNRQLMDVPEVKPMRSWIKRTILLIAGIVFSGVPVALLIDVSRTYIQSTKLENAVQVPANILHAERVHTGGGRGGSSARTTVHYSYAYNGHNFRGDLIALWKGTDCERFKELAAAKESGQQIPCFVDPDDPTLATLDNEFSVGPLIGVFIAMVMFGGVGVLTLRALYLDLTAPKEGYSIFVPGFSQKTKMTKRV